MASHSALGSGRLPASRRAGQGPDPDRSRIIVAADTYRAITSDRRYRPARSHGEAIEELSRCARSQFDPAVSAALIGHPYGERQAGSLVA